MHLKRGRVAYVAAVISSAFVCAYGQTPTSGQPSPKKTPPAAPAKKTATPAPAKPTVEDIIKMADAKLGESIIVATIKRNGNPFDLSPDQLVALKKASVSDAVIEIMMDPSRPYPPPAPVKPEPAHQPISANPPPASPPNSPVDTPAGSTKPPTPPSGAVAAAVDSDLPTGVDIGAFYKKGGKWEEMLPEVVNWKTGGVLKHIASAGIVQGDVNGHLPGAHSRNSAASPVEVLIFTPDGTAITEYQLIHLHEQPDSREFRTVTGGVMHASGGATRDVVPFEGKKVANRIYRVLLPNLGAGEYGFLPPGAFTSASSASIGKMYTFRLIE